MGSASSSHASCPDHPGGLIRVDNYNVLGARCGVCQDPVQVGATVHRCRETGCPFVLHDACFRLPVKVKRHFAHPKHHLVLDVVEDGQRVCRLCGKSLGAHTFEYSCAKKKRCADGGFHLHPRCCMLPQTMYFKELHPAQHGMFVLRSSSGGGERRRCLKCNRRDTRSSSAWSYQCPRTEPECNDTEICLNCVLGNQDTVRCGCCCDVEAGPLGVWIGGLFCGIGQGMGLPCFRVPPTIPAR